MAKTSIEREAGQEGSLREGLEAAIRERVHEIIEIVLGEEVEAARPRLVICDGNPGLAAALDRQWPGAPHQRCTVHKLRNLIAKAPKHAHEAVREDYHRIVYAETLEAAQKAREAFLGKWKKQYPGVAASLEEAGEELLTFYRFPASQWVSLRTTNTTERRQQEFRRRVKTQAALPTEGAVLPVFFGLWVSGQMKLRRIKGYRDMGGKEKVAA